MKTITMLLMLIATMATAQKSYDLQDLLTKKIIEKTEGYTDEVEVQGDSIRIVTIKLPIYYNLDLTRMMINQVLDSYSDIYIVEPWHRRGTMLNTSILVAKKYIYVIETDSKEIIFATFNND